MILTGKGSCTKGMAFSLDNGKCYCTYSEEKVMTEDVVLMS